MAARGQAAPERVVPGQVVQALRLPSRALLLAAAVGRARLQLGAAVGRAHLQLAAAEARAAAG